MPTTLITADEFADMSFDVPVELIQGEIVAMTHPGGWHGTVCFNAAVILGTWLRTSPEYVAATNNTGVVTRREPDTVLGPDLLVIQRGKLPNREIPRKHFSVPPDVAIEVRSPSDRWSETLLKVGEFLAAGTGEVWIINPERRRIHVYRTDDEPTVFSGADAEVSSPLLPGFRAPAS